MYLMHRRSFLQLPGAGLAAAQFTPRRRYRAVILGHTGAGNYGHEWDTAWKRVPAVEVVAVADPDDAGRAKAQARSGAQRSYRDYREMLAKEKPDLATICPRATPERVGMVQAAAGAGAHILMEKPFAGTLADADAMLQAIGKKGLKVQVAHVARGAAVTRRVKALLDAGAIGTLLEMRGRGKEDRRAGGEDLIVLGSHVLDLMRYFAGDPKWVFAHVTEGGEELKPSMMRRATEPLGPVGGDRIEAMFGFASGVHGHLATKAADARDSNRYGLTLYGSRGVVFVPLTAVPSEPPLLLKNSRWVPAPGQAWERIEYPPDARQVNRADANHAMAVDLVEAIERDRKPLCDARDGRWTIEMIEGVYQSQFAHTRLEFPLARRSA